MRLPGAQPNLHRSPGSWRRPASGCERIGSPRPGGRRLRLGSARTTAVVDDIGPILDLGSGAFPNAAADIL